MNWAMDDLTGEGLDPIGVTRARRGEIQYVRQKKVWVKVPRKWAAAQGIKIVGAKWVDINKGDETTPVLRSSFVSKEFNNGVGDGLFATTPSLEALRALVSKQLV